MQKTLIALFATAALAFPAVSERGALNTYNLVARDDDIFAKCAKAKNCEECKNAKGERDICIKKDSQATKRDTLEARQGAGYHFETDFKLGDSAAIFGCADPGEVKPGDILEKLITAQCPENGGCTPGKTQDTKIFWVVPDDGVSEQWKDGTKLSVEATGDYINQSERDGFIGFIKAYAEQEKASLRKSQDFATPAVENSPPRRRVATVVQRDDDYPKPSEIPSNPGDKATCELVHAAASYALWRWKRSDTDSDDYTLSAKFTADVTVDNPQKDLCKALTTAFGSIAGALPVVGGAISAVIGSASLLCG